MRISKKIKLIIFSLILIFSFFAFIYLYVISEETKLEKNIILLIILELFVTIPFLFFLLGFGFFYISFKIVKGRTFIYKDCSKAKILDNIDIDKTYHNRIFIIPMRLFEWIFIIIAIISLFIPHPIIKWCIFIPSIIRSLYYIFHFFFFCFNEIWWIYYVKFLRWIGISYFETDLNQTINQFLIQKTNKNKLNSNFIK